MKEITRDTTNEPTAKIKKFCCDKCTSEWLTDEYGMQVATTNEGLVNCPYSVCPVCSTTVYKTIAVE